MNKNMPPNTHFKGNHKNGVRRADIFNIIIGREIGKCEILIL